jgi:hypothetical protein
MKFAKLLVLSALWLVAGSAMALDDVREKPALPKTQGFVASESTDQYYYLFNVQAQKFFTEGNAWGTQVSLGETGLKVAFVPDGGAYLFNDYSLSKNAWKLTFFDNENQMFVDLGSQPNYRWGVEEHGATFRLFAASAEEGNPGWDDGAKPAYREGMYMGWVAGSNSTACTPYLEVAEGNCIDWAFVLPEDYEPYESGIGIYNAGHALKGTIEEAQELGANVTDALAVYNNLASTVEEMNAAANKLTPNIESRKALKAALDEDKAKGFTATEEFDAVFANPDATKTQLDKALEDLNAAIIEWGKNNASVANPADMTAKIKNPNFNNASSAGWSGDAPNMTGSGAHGPANVAEKWNATFDTYQDIEELPAGVYALSAQTMWRGSWNDMQKHVGPASKLYASFGGKEVSVPFNYAYAPLNTESMAGDTPWGVGAGEQSYTDEETGTTYYIPNDPSCFRLYAEKGLYDTKVLFGYTEGTLRIGVKNPSMMGDADNWSVFDTFKLTYYGTGADAAQLYLDETIKNYSELTLGEDEIYTESYLEAYNAELKKEISANSFEEVSAAMAEIEAAKAALDNNLKLWKDWQAKVDVAYKDYMLNTDYEGLISMDAIGDYYMDTEYILEERALTNEELEAEIAKLDQMMADVKAEFLSGDIADGTDMTKYIINPTFEKNNTENTGNHDGWTVNRGDGGGNITEGPIGGAGDTFLEKCGYYNAAFESWHRYNWDVWQEIEDLPKGMYELNVQGYVRCEVGGYTKGNDLTDYPSPVFLYMNSATAQFPNVYSQVPADYGIEFQIVEDWTQETINDAIFPNSMGGAAQCFNNPELYKMTAYGLIAKKGDKFRIGVRMEGNQDWWCIWDNFKLTYRKPTVDIVKPILEEEMAKLDPNQGMGSEVIEGLNKVREDAVAALASNDGDQMFDALVAVYDISDAIRASMKRFSELNTANEDLAYAIPFADDMTIRAEGDALYQQIYNGIENHTIATEEIDGLLNQIARMINRLGIPEGMAAASDANPVECTGVIVNPSYVEGNDKGWTGSAAINAVGTDAEKFNTNYNYYQLLQGLPAGTYQVTLTGYYRAGSAANDYTTWIESPEENNNALLYAVGEGGDTCTVAMMRLASQAQKYESLPDSYAWASEENQLAVPNSMTTGGDLFMTENEATGKNFYAGNCVTVKVGEDGNLTIGLKKGVTLQDDWTLWTNWQLFYYGTNSALEPNIDTSIKEMGSNEAVKVEVFNVNGARLNKAQKGLVIVKKTMSDGSVKVLKKVQK